jgi:serine/threonine-protein kinase
MKACPKCGKEYPDSTTLCPADGIALEKKDDSLLGQTLAGKYRIDERLSEGGMGTVYRGTHVMMDKVVAVKVLRPSFAADEKIVARFSREARAASKLLHPHALSVTDFGEDENGVVFLVMEYLDGSTLKDMIRKEGPMPLTRIVPILRQIGSALEAAHAEGVVHRDLKSDNIMLLSSYGTDYAKVLDFGIAKIKEPEGGYDPGLTAPDLVIGTPQYMSPEQCSQSPDIDSRSDLYSLGIILYEMLVGHVPFAGGTPTAIMLKQLQQPVPSVREERKDVPAAVARVVARALEKRPEDRYQKVAELVEDFTIASGMEPTPTPASLPRIEAPVISTPPEEDDEETVMRSRVTRPMTPPPPDVPEPASQAAVQHVIPLPGPPLPTASTFNPWKIIVPSVVALLVLFGVIYAFTRNSQPTETTTSGTTLAADPNSSPVEPTKPATGESEANIPAGGSTGQTNANVSASPAATETPVNIGDIDVNANSNSNNNSNSNSNSNSNKNPPLPSPTKPATSGSPAVPEPSKAPTLPPPSTPPPAEPTLN